METYDRPLPHSVESERAVLGAIMLDNRLLPQAQAQLAPEDFYLRPNRATYAAMLDVSDDEINPVTVAAALRAAGKLEEVGGVSYLSELSYGLPAVSSLAPYLRRLKENSALRALIRLGSGIVDQALEAGGEAKEIAGWADEQLRRIGVLREAGGFRDFAHLADETADIYERMFRNDVLTVPTGFSEIDEGPRSAEGKPTGGLTGGGFAFTDLVIIAGKASHGKTSLALDIAVNAARSGFPVGIASLEMADTSLFMRAHSAESGVERWKMRSGIYEPDFCKLIATLEAMRGLPVHVSHSISNVEDFMRQARALVRDKGARLLIVDYLQLLRTEARYGSRNNEVGGIARQLTNLALTLQTPVIALSQLSREHDRDGREPELRDLRDSGEIEQHADTVFLLYGDKPEEGATFREVKVKCAKQREGKLFKAELVFNGELLTFRNTLPPAPVGDSSWYEGGNF